MKQGSTARLMAIAIAITIAISRPVGADDGAAKTQVTQELMVDRYASPEFQELARFRQEQHQRMVAMAQERAEYLPGLRYRRGKIEKKTAFVSFQSNRTINKVLKFTDTAKKVPSINDQDTSFLNLSFPVTEEKPVKIVKKMSSEFSVRQVRSVKYIREKPMQRGKIKVTVTNKKR